MTLSTDTLAQLAQWTGRSELRRDTIAPAPMRALAATLHRSAPAEALPPHWHWLYFLPTHAWSELGEDGHARRGGFLPPVPAAAPFDVCGRPQADGTAQLWAQDAQGLLCMQATAELS